MPNIAVDGQIIGGSEALTNPTLTGAVSVGGASDTVGFYGTTPIAKPSGAAEAAVTDGSTGVAAPTNGVLPSTGTYNSTILNNSMATILAQTNAMRTALVNLGLIKGSA